MRSWPRPRLTIGVSCGSGTKVVRAGMTDETAGAGRRAWPLEAGGPWPRLTGQFPMRTLPSPRRSVDVRSVGSGTVHRLHQWRE